MPKTTLIRISRILVLLIAICSALAAPETTSAQGGTWSSKAPMPIARGGAAVGVVNGVLYAVGGCASSCVILNHEAYDPISSTWMEKASVPSTTKQGAPQQGFNNLAAGAINGILYFVGDRNGTFYSMALLAYDPVNNTWTEKTPPPTQRSGVSVGVVNGILYAVGGSFFNNGSTNYISVVEAYDPVTDSWTTKASLLTPRVGAAVGMANGMIYVVGGSNGSGVLPTLEAYDPVSNTWGAKPPMPTARTSLGVGVVNGILYAVGGSDGTNALTTTEAYDPVTDTWKTQAAMPAGTIASGIGVVGSVLYAVRSYNNNGVSATNQAFTPDSDNDSGFSQLNGGNAFNGNQTINGNVNATNFIGNGSALTGVNAVSLGGISASNFARLDIGNLFNGNQTVNGSFLANGSGEGIRGNGVGGGSIGVIGNGNFGVEGLGNTYGVYGSANTGVYGFGGYIGVQGTGATGVSGTSGGTAGAFNVTNNSGKILSGLNSSTGSNVEVFSVGGNGAVTIGAGGAPIVKHLSQTFSASFPSLKPSTCSSLTFTFTGTSDGDTTALGIPNAMMAVGNVIYSGWVNATNSVTIRACNVNPNGPATTAASGTVRVDIWKH